VLAEHEGYLLDRMPKAAAADYSQPLRTRETIVRPELVDYNNHLSESAYLRLFGEATDAFLALLGVDARYRAESGSFFTAETHIVHLNQVAGLEPVAIATQLLDCDDKRLRVFHRMSHARNGTPLATGEHMLIHVDAGSGRAGPAAPAVRAKAREVLASHARLARPAEAGRSVGQPRPSKVG
jgi:carnitine 3-dehydrogenase